MKMAIIIGAGPAGLTAAYQLLKETDIKPIILEETEFIGGISRTVQYHGNRIDLGGHRFFSKNQQIMDIWKEIMPIQGAPAQDDLMLKRDVQLCEGGPDPETEERVSLIRTRISRIYFLKKFFDYPITFKKETFLNMGLLRTVKAGCGYLYSCIVKRKERSLEDFYINRFGKPLYAMFFEDYTEKVWGKHPSEIAADWGAQRVKGLSISKILKEIFMKTVNKQYHTKETSLIDQFIYPKYGPGELWEAMANEIIKMGGEIHFNTKVTGIRPAHSYKRIITGVVAQTTCNNHINTKEYKGDYYISSMPIKDLIEAFESAVPATVYNTAIKLPYRDFITVGLLVKKLNIKNETKMKTIQDRIPDCWIYVQEREVKIGRIQIFNNWSPYMPKDNLNTMWIGLEYFCNEGDEMWNMSPEEFIEFAKTELEKIHIAKKSDILDAVHIKVKKAYPAYFGTYEHISEVQDFLSEFQNLFCVGRNGQHRYNNMDHSMLTAIEAVKLIKKNSLDKTVLWKVNTEKTYHEKK